MDDRNALNLFDVGFEFHSSEFLFICQHARLNAAFYILQTIFI